MVLFFGMMHGRPHLFFPVVNPVADRDDNAGAAIWYTDGRSNHGGGHGIILMRSIVLNVLSFVGVEKV
jgi:hypothetical protein